MERQTDLLTQLMAKPKEQKKIRSTIKIEPRVSWPTYGDDGPGGREVEEFYEKLEDITGLANDGDGASDREMNVSLRMCLQGSRKTIHDNIYKMHKYEAATDEGQGKIYKAVKERLPQFLETATEKHLAKWRDLQKKKKKHQTALQFEAEWEHVHADLEEIGLGVKPMENFLQYIAKVGAPISEKIRMDRGQRKNKDGEWVTRCPETWEEAQMGHTMPRDLGRSPRSTVGDRSYQG